MEPTGRFHALVSGRVQGVGFRFFVYEQARRRGLTGWVRNRGTAQLEVLAEGTPEALRGLLEALRQGPPLSWVERVVTDWQEPTDEFRGFDLRPSTH
jgi:acylphosphatase